MEPLELRDGLLYHEGLVYVPDNDEVKLEILRSCHDAKTAGHFGQAKTLELVNRSYYWPEMRSYINEYVKSCDVCARNKLPRHAKFGPLHPLPVPERPWGSVAMDYIVELPPSNGYNAIYVCVDRFTKMAHFCPTTMEVTAEATASLYVQHVYKLHGLPDDIVSDRGTQFTSKFTRALLTILGVRGNRSTAYHPQSDGQTERVNQVLEQYLRIFCDYQQDDWAQLLPLAEFAYNNACSMTTGTSPFRSNYGYHPRASIQAPIRKTDNPTAEGFVEELKSVQEKARGQIKTAQEAQKRNYDRHTKQDPGFKAGDRVWLLRKNIATERPSQKLEVRRLGPFLIKEAVGDSKRAFRLELPPQMRLHPVFHVSLLEPYTENKIPGRTQQPPLPTIIEQVPEYTVNKILDSKIQRGRLKYYVDWEGYGPEERT